MSNNSTSISATSRRPASWSDRAGKAIPRIAVPAIRTLNSEAARNLGPVLVVLLARPFIGVAAFVAMALTGSWVAAPLVLWFLYGSTATALHHLIHGGLGLSPRARHAWLSVLGFLILESGHAWQTTHVMHHRDGTDLPDPEGYIEYLSWTQLPLGALQWRFRIAAWGWRNGPHRQRTTCEISANIALTIGSIALLRFTPLLAIYVAMMQLGTFLFAVLLAKGPQTNFGREASTPLVIVHTRILGLLLFNHHLHVEHHAYPKVPMSRLHHLRPTVEQALANQNIHHVHLAI